MSWSFGREIAPAEGVEGTPRRGRRALITAAILGAVAVFGAVTVTDAAQVPKTTVILGETATPPDPSCPDLPCQAIGSVTGFQINNGQTANPFLVTKDGTITAWTLTLAQPTNSQRSFFNSFFGTPPEARLSIIRRVAGTNPPRYNLIRQGAIQVLSPYMGQTVKFGSNLKVEKGDIVAISVPTWAPAFAQELSESNSWRASRAPGTCTNSNEIKQGEPQSKVGKRATYGCKYTTARLLYTATLTEDR